MKNQTTNNEFKLLSISETCEVLGIDRTSVKYLFNTNQLDYVVIGKQKRTSISRIQQMKVNNLNEKKPKIKHTGLVQDFPKFMQQFKKGI